MKPMPVIRPGAGKDNRPQRRLPLFGGLLSAYSNHCQN
jgi:hypothetical protein